jgi:hypothetical protein
MRFVKHEGTKKELNFLSESNIVSYQLTFGFGIRFGKVYSSPSIFRVIKARRMRWAGHVARMGEVRGTYNILVGRPEGRRPLGRPRRRWEDNVKMDLREIVFGDVD